MRKIESTRARQEFSDTLNQVAYGRERIVLRRHGKDVAALIPMSDLELLRQCEETFRKRGRPSRKAARVPTARRRRS
jgi:prevent-host-death family protein